MNALRTSRHVRRLLLTFAAAGTLAAGIGASTASATTRISWSTFPFVSGEDTIEMSYVNGAVARNEIQVCLETADNVTWRKGIQWDARRSITPWPWTQPEYPYVNVANLALQDSNHGPVCVTRPIADFFNYTLSTNNTFNKEGRLRFGKAKFLGIYTDMYELPLDNAHAWPGRSYRFRWTRDR